MTEVTFIVTNKPSRHIPYNNCSRLFSYSGILLTAVTCTVLSILLFVLTKRTEYTLGLCYGSGNFRLSVWFVCHTVMCVQCGQTAEFFSLLINSTWYARNVAIVGKR